MIILSEIIKIFYDKFKERYLLQLIIRIYTGEKWKNLSLGLRGTHYIVNGKIFHN